MEITPILTITGFQFFFSELSLQEIPDKGVIDSWIKIAFTVFVLVLVPVYWRHWGPTNFLWFSDVALILCVPALWMESSLLASMMAVGVLLPEIYWNIELLIRLLTGRSLAGLTDYMFDRGRPLYLRLLSLFHVALPAVLILMLTRLGYDSRALYFQIFFALVILILTYNVTVPEKNINWVYGFGKSPQHKLDSRLFLCIVIVSYCIFIFLPTHFLLNWIFA